MEYLKKAGVYIVTIESVTMLSDDQRFAEGIKNGSRKDCYIVKFKTKKGEAAQQRFYPPLETDSQSAKEFKDKKLSDFCRLGGNQEFTHEGMMLMQGKSIKGLFRQKEYLSMPEPGKMYLNETMEFMWGASVEDTMEFNEQFAVKRLSPQDQAKYDAHLANYRSQQAQNTQVEEQYTAPGDTEEDDLPF